MGCVAQKATLLFTLTKGELLVRAVQKGKTPTMADVARLAQVSQQTVSRVLNDYAFIKPDTRERVRQAIASLDYRPNIAARTLATSRSRTIGVVASDYTSFGPASALWAVEEAAREAGYAISIVSLREANYDTISQALARLAGQSVEGIVMIAPQDVTASAAFVSFDNVPVVTLSSVDTGEHTAIMYDSVEGSRAATQHLIDLGHRWIAHLAGPAGFTVSESRIHGWRKALADAHLVAADPFVCDWSAASGYAAGRRLLGDGRFTAAYCANDRIAQGLLLALHEGGLQVPRDFSVVGFDDVPEAAFYIPPLTTMRQDFSALGRRCIDALVVRIKGDPPREADPLLPVLVERASTARLI
jgi:DNA-binding LacI/PurR family transcriptional regulator